MTTAPERGVLTIPNLISLARLLCVPVFLWLLLGPDRPIAAGVLFAVLGATDWVDGYIARHVAGQASELGKVLDPVADRALLVAGAIALLVVDLPAAVDVILWIVLAREVLIAVATVGLGLAGARRIDVVWAGKAGTLALMFGLPLFLVADNTDGAWHAVWTVCAWGFAIGGLVLGYYAAMKYVPAARAALREGRADRVQSGAVRAKSAESEVGAA
jgi:cardiolipin synthase (CMP-forming)